MKSSLPSTGYRRRRRPGSTTEERTLLRLVAPAQIVRRVLSVNGTWRLIQLLAMLDLVYKVKTPKTTVHFADKQLVPNQSLRQTHLKWHIKEPEEVQELLAA